MNRENAGYANTVVGMVKDWKFEVRKIQEHLEWCKGKLDCQSEIDYALAASTELRNRMNSFILSVEGKK